MSEIEQRRRRPETVMEDLQLYSAQEERTR